jgi:xanthine dehydrogenase accessory factor
VLFGAGHVGRALMQVLAGLPCQVRWIDSRAQAFDDLADLAGRAGNVQCIVCAQDDELIDEAAHLPAGSDVLVMTHSHALDQQLCEVLLRRGDFSYLGLIGSATKRSLFERRLAERGISAAQLARLTCPIGIAGISGKEPGVIAVAIVAQLLQRRQQG